MIQLYHKMNNLKVLEVFLTNPYEGYYVRELSRLSGCSPMTALRACRLLMEDGLIVEQKMKGRNLFRGNLDATSFRFTKIAYNLERIERSGLVAFLDAEFEDIHSLVLYGSFAKGRDGPRSDIDLAAIVPRDRAVELKRFEKALGHPVSLEVFTTKKWADQAKSNRAFYMDIITEGIVLLGRRPVID